MNQISPAEAYRFFCDNPEVVFVDVRCDIEYLFVGHPEGALSIPWRNEPDWEINPDFLSKVREAASINRAIILICKSGCRSKEAGAFLKEHGFTEVYNVLHGFEGDLDGNYHRSSINGWRHDGLPWQQC